MIDLQKTLFLAFIYLSPISLVFSIILFLTSLILKIKNRNYKKVFIIGLIFLMISILIFIIPAIIIGFFGVAPE
ncbi:hypothetical protein EDD65_11269 [Keratinibaculum paraultunense]|uniref:Uncharacterized protein n=1 Tax=Keratinibaculum paraultunense TaxID=1278232 RepID=A0A4R3KR75_9FIRM|nr:hypothetical protein [Keratinibaculum paraultunense]QQY79687.1 hypothetical protein JL105_10985 [Keratinibaculum paraultunense]TCS87111.1 hypothetical protein EDD65_11269 [Keratinibaculum paraultunense]